MEWWTVIELWVIAVLACVGIPLVWLYARRRWLSRSGGTFDCALRPSGGNKPWQLGAARYQGEYLEWFRIFSLGLSPRFRMRRSTMHVLESREAEPADELYGDERVLEVEFGTAKGERQVEVAMDHESATGLLSWIEAAPPSIDRFPDT
ncbi:DUF2550 domain-containing protein [Propioniferax innocua]|uniref:Uncharacterized protein DUF2550 n=1 Tax=Propioniferax innocua TaxID=1753 RepID=A0A542ZB65_9ACTN|nr:DUF2550 domain-containing protein [Propioniferax innocua]TQL57579.1 uncharacterized protein DUF2550 [Propioniferax innocua]